MTQSAFFLLLAKPNQILMSRFETGRKKAAKSERHSLLVRAVVTEHHCAELLHTTSLMIQRVT